MALHSGDLDQGEYDAAMNRRSLELLLGRVQYNALCAVGLGLMRGRSRSVRVGDVRMPYLEGGRGDPVVLVHGFAANKETWLLTAVPLSRSYHLVIPDLPGYGAADAIPPSRATAREQAVALVRFLDAIGLDRVHLVGNSMGGGITLRVARDFPERVRTATLIDAAGPKVEPSELDRLLDRGINPLLPESTDDAEGLMRFIAEKQRYMPAAMRRYAVSTVVDARDRLQQQFEVWRRGRGADGVPEDIEEIRVPTLVIHGDCDRLIDVSTGRALGGRIPGAELVVLSGVGHVPQLEVARKTARLIDDFLSAV